MLIDRSQRNWGIATLLLTLLATATYLWYAAVTPGGPSGGTIPGLIYGILGSALMIFAGLLSARKKRPTSRLGRLSTWLRGHLWLGLLSVPLILFHAAFRLGGTVEQALWLVLAIVILSGIFGVVMQNIIPRMMTAQVPMETVYEQITQVCEAIRREADAIVAETCGPWEGMPVDERMERKKKKGKEEQPIPEAARLKDFYLKQVRPFLDPVYHSSNRLARASAAEGTFEQMRLRLPPALEEPLEQLAHYCEERRQLARQAKLHHWLHGWLFLHVPLSFALLGLGIAHAIAAIFY
jgi:hypothetical protein